MKGHARIALYLLAVFVSGILVGGVGHRLYTVSTVSAAKLTPQPKVSPEAHRARMLEEYRTRLSLEADQVASIRGIMDGTRERFRSLKEAQKLEEEKIRQEHRSSIRALLKGSQLQEYENLLEERERARRANADKKN